MARRKITWTTSRVWYTADVLRASLAPLAVALLAAFTPAQARAEEPGAAREVLRGRSSQPWDRTLRDEDLQIKLVTFGPGDAVHQYWGHNALAVEDERRGVALLYNFGMFGFGGDMLPKYLRGQLEFWVAAMPVRPTLEHYVAENRSVSVRELDLPPDRRRYLAERLAWYALPENREYLYHHYENNCSTKLRDLIDEAMGGQLREQNEQPARLSYRGHTRRYTEHDPIVHFLLVLWMNDSMEGPIPAYNEAFLPDELERMVDAASFRDEQGNLRPLVELGYTVYQARRPPVPPRPSTVWPGVLALGIALGGVAFALGRRRGPRWRSVAFGLYQAAIGVVLGLPGLVLGLFLLTGWEVTHWNENLLLTNPLTFLALPFGLLIALRMERAEAVMRGCWFVLLAGSLLLLPLKLLPAFDQQTYLPMCLYLPVNLGFAAASWLRRAPSQPEPAPSPAA